MKTWCTVSGCDRQHYGRGYCELHYHRKYNAGLLDRNQRPTPHERINFIITRAENERWAADVARRFERWDAVRTSLWHDAHATAMDAAAD